MSLSEGLTTMLEALTEMLEVKRGHRLTGDRVCGIFEGSDIGRDSGHLCATGMHLRGSDNALTLADPDQFLEAFHRLTPTKAVILLTVSSTDDRSSMLCRRNSRIAGLHCRARSNPGDAPAT